MDKKTRKQSLDLFIGGNGSGKTTLQIQKAIDYVRKTGKRVLIILADDGEDKFESITEIDRSQLLTFVGIKKFILESVKDFIFIAETFKSKRDEKTGIRSVRKFNGLMLCDDLGGIMNRRPNEILMFFKKRRQPNIDFVFAFHGLRADVPPSFYTYVNRLILFKTSDTHEDIMKNLPENKREEFLAMYRRVQAHPDPHYKEEMIIMPLSI